MRSTSSRPISSCATSLIATSQPSSARQSAIPRPIPRSCAAPVTRATFPSKRLIGRPLVYERGRGRGGTGRFPHRKQVVAEEEGGSWGKHGFPPRERAGG